MKARNDQKSCWREAQLVLVKNSSTIHYSKSTVCVGCDKHSQQVAIVKAEIGHDVRTTIVHATKLNTTTSRQREIIRKIIHEAGPKTRTWQFTILTKRCSHNATTVERKCLASVLLPSCTRPVADGWPLMWLKPSAIGQPTRPTQPFIFWGSINE